MIEVEKIYKVKLNNFHDPLEMKAVDLNLLAVLLYQYADQWERDDSPELAAIYREDALKISRMLDEAGHYDDLEEDRQL